MSCHQLDLAPWHFKAAWEIEEFTAEHCTTVVLQLNRECFVHLHISYGSDLKIRGNATISESEL